MPRPETPELDKMVKITEQSQPIGEFLEWLSAEGYWSDQPNTTRLLAEYFKINLDAVEKERRALLEWVREQGTS